MTFPLLLYFICKNREKSRGSQTCGPQVCEPRDFLTSVSRPGMGGTVYGKAGFGSSLVLFGIVITSPSKVAQYVRRMWFIPPTGSLCNKKKINA